MGLMGLFGRKKQEQAKDPVCGMTVDPAKAAGTATHEGKTFHFCSPGCLSAFQKDPHQYGH